MPNSTSSIGLLDRLGAMHEADEPPLRAVDRGLVVRRLRFHDVPMESERVEASCGGRANRQQTDPVQAGKFRSGRRGDGGNGNIEEGIRVGSQMKPRVPQFPSVILEGDRFLRGEQFHDHAKPVFEKATGLRLRNSNHNTVGR